MAEPTPLEYGRPARRPLVRRWLAYPAVIVFAAFVFTGLLIPSSNHSRETANRARCASNLQRIGLTIVQYQQHHGGAYPDTLGQLLLAEPFGVACVICPGGNEEQSTAGTPASVAAEIDAGPAGHHCSYLYFGRGLRGDVSAATVIACDAPADHDGDGVNALYADGHAVWEPPGRAVSFVPAEWVPHDPRWQRALAATRAAGPIH